MKASALMDFAFFFTDVMGRRNHLGLTKIQHLNSDSYEYIYFNPARGTLAKLSLNRGISFEQIV